jgi:uncharacterized protein YjdB
MKTRNRRIFSRKALAIIVAVAMVLTVAPMTASAWLDVPHNSAATADTLTLGTQVQFGLPEPDPLTQDGTYNDVNGQWYKFTVPAASILTIAFNVPPQGTAQHYNALGINLYAENTTQHIPNLENISNPQVQSDKTVTSQTVHYKVVPGTYYLKGSGWWSSGTLYGFATVTAESVTEDFGGEPNDTTILSKEIAIGTSYTGNIRNHGKSNGSGGFSQDWYDYYKVKIAENNTTIRLTASRADTTVVDDLRFEILNANGGREGEQLSLKNEPEGSKDYTLEKAGTYYVYVNGYITYDETEYTFTLTKQVTPRITLPAKVSVDKGKTVKIKRTVTGSVESDYEWTSSNTNVATVTTNGVVKGISAGTATISAKSTVHSNLVAYTTVTVKIPVKSVTLDKKKATIKLNKNKKLTLKATVKPSNATVKKVTWTSSNKKIATVSKTGVVTAKKAGKVTITATSNNKKIGKCVVTVKKR